MEEQGNAQRQSQVQRQADLYRVAPIFATSLSMSVYEQHLAVITFFSGIPTDPQEGVISEVGVGSFAITKNHARFLAEALMKFVEGGADEGQG
jgi:hypothetical protein